MKTRLAPVAVLLFGGLALLSVLGIARAQLATPQAAATLTICTDTTWQQMPSGGPAVLTANGPQPGSIHDLPGAQSIWDSNGAPNSSAVLLKSITLPADATSVVATATFVADDGAVIRINGQEIGSYDAMIWPPPTSIAVTNLVAGQNTIRAEVYNRPSWAWFEFCLSIAYEEAAAGNVYLPAVIYYPQSVVPTATATATATLAATATTTATPSPTATGPALTNLLIGNMPLPNGWHASGSSTYWEGYLRVQDETVIEMTLYDCGDNSANNRLDIVQVYDPGNNLVLNQPNCSGSPTFTIPTAGKPGLYRVFLKDNDTRNGNGGNIWVNKLRDQRIYTDPTDPTLAATNLLTQTESLPGGWVTGGRLTFWEGYIHIQNESEVTVTATDCGDDEGNRTLDGIQITDPSGLIVGAVSGCNSSSRTFPINTQGKPGWYRLYFFDKDTGVNPGRSPAQNGGALSVTNLVDQHVYPTPGEGQPPTATPTPTATPPSGSGWQPLTPGSASGGGISNNGGASQGVTMAVGPNNHLYVAWSDTSAGDAEIYLRRWDGTSWSDLGGSASGGGISNNGGASLWPSLAVAPDGNPWVAWHDETPGAAEIYIKRWTGTAWEPVGSGSASGGGISNNSGASAFVDLQIASNGHAFTVWADDSAGNDEIYLRQWNGSAWVALANSASGGGISNSGNRSGRPALALNAGLPAVAWAEGGSVGDIYLRRFSGSAWVELGTNSASGGGVSHTAGSSQYATLAYTAAGKPYVAWYDETSGQREIYVATLEGSQWIAAGTGAASGGGISNTSGASKEPSLAVAGSGNPFVAWQETPASDNEIYIRRLSGGNWVPVSTGSATGGGISDNGGNSNFPVLAFAAGGPLYIAWEDNSSGNHEIYVLMNTSPE